MDSGEGPESHGYGAGQHGHSEVGWRGSASKDGVINLGFKQFPEFAPDSIIRRRVKVD